VSALRIAQKDMPRSAARLLLSLELRAAGDEETRYEVLRSVVLSSDIVVASEAAAANETLELPAHRLAMAGTACMSKYATIRAVVLRTALRAQDPSAQSLVRSFLVKRAGRTDGASAERLHRELDRWNLDMVRCFVRPSPDQVRAVSNLWGVTRGGLSKDRAAPCLAPARVRDTATRSEQALYAIANIGLRVECQSAPGDQQEGVVACDCAAPATVSACELHRTFIEMQLHLRRETAREMRRTGGWWMP